MMAPGVIQYTNVAELGTLKSDEVLLKIQKIGVCGSDIHVYRGEHPATPYPVVQGHEYSAIVAAVGDGVTKVKPEMRATARPQLVCGECGPCKRGQYNICQNLKVQGFQAPGAAQDYFVVSEKQVVPFPENMSFEEGALIEPSAVGAHATRRASSLEGKNVVVSGAGTIGNLVAQFAKLRGAEKVLITDVSDYRLNIARECGIDAVLNVAKYRFEQEVENIFGAEGFQVGFDAAGVQASLDQLLKNIEKGGEIVIVGVYANNPQVDMYFLGEHELKMIGTLMYLHEDYQDAVDAIAGKKVNVQKLITHHFPFDQYDKAYDFIEKQKDGFLKVMIDM
jgi:L-iditol 2-dehydrogenase/threonine 3-dehydrogenase